MSSTRALSFVAVSLAVAATPAASAESSWRLRAEAGPGVDSNALRVVGSSAGSAAVFTGAALKGELRAAGETWLVNGRLSEGLRAFAGEPGANLVASRLDLAARRTAGPRLELGLDAMARDLRERGGARDQHELVAAGNLRRAWNRLALEGAAGWALSAPRAAGLRVFRRDGPEASLAVALRVSREHALRARYGYSAWEYRAWTGGRSDREHAATLEWVWDGPALASLTYGYGRNESSFDAGRWRRHRITARLACDLPAGFDLAGRLTVQRSRHPNGAILSEQLFVREGDEAQNALELQLARRIRSDLDLALKVAHYRSELGAEAGLEFRRTVGQLALAWTIGR